MKRGFIIWNELNSMGFGVRVDSADYDKAKELTEEGFNRWFDTDKYPEYHDVGYAEPAMELLDEAGIEYEIMHVDELTMSDYIYYDKDLPEWCDEVI